MNYTASQSKTLEFISKYGKYHYSTTFDVNDDMAAVLDSEPAIPAYSAAFDAEEGLKRHAACDECRKRKLKCSGEQTGCSRCVKQNLVCHFSEQKQMGRPRKKQKTSDDNEQEPTLPTEAEVVVQKRRFRYITDPEDRASLEALCTGPITQYLKNYTPPPRQVFMASGPLYEHSNDSLTSEMTPPSNGPTTPPSNLVSDPIYPTDVALWPDYSTMLNLPMVVQTAHEKDPPNGPSDPPSYSHSSTSFDSLSTLPSTPACPCLPNLYLTLSTLSTLSSFPVSSHTIDSLQTAARTAHSVLYCTICPQRFQSGMQNVMLLGTLLTVLADGWHRVRNALPEDLRKGFGPAQPNSSFLEPLNACQNLQWLTFAHNLIRANVFGDSLSPTPPSAYHRGVSTTSPTAPHSLCILALIESMERRQSQWHHPGTATGEFPKRLEHIEHDGHLQGMTLADIEATDVKEGGHLCLKIVESAKRVIKALDGEAPTF